MKKSHLIVSILTPFCIWAAAGASDPPKNAPNPAKSGAEQQILGDKNLIASGLAERSDGDLILSEECPLGYTIFGQIPTTVWDNAFGGYASDINGGRRIFDNFWDLSSDICSITWWGFDLYIDNGLHDCTEDPMDFEVAFYPDDGSGRPDTLNPIYVLPSVTLTPIPTGQMYYYYRSDGILWYELNRYELELDPCIAATEGWFSVMAISYGGDPRDCWFVWITALGGDGISWRLWFDQGWNPVQYDVAFCLGGSEYYPTYGACCDPFARDCQSNVEYQDCPQGSRFEAGVSCEDLDPACGIVCEEFEYSLNTFTNYEAGDPAGWHWTYGQGNTPGSAFHPDSNVVDGCDDWLISPGDFTVVAGDSLAWDQMGLYSEYCDYHGVLVSSNYVNGNDPTTITWAELYTGAAPEDAWETITVDLSDFAGETVHFAFRYRGDYADQWWVDNVCVICVSGGGSDCVYIPGDCNCNGVPAELPDVIAMIGMYRGSVEHCYECPCPPHGDDFAPNADPNGNCIPDELPDVVAEIGIYRGTVEALGCEDCPGSLRLMPGADSPASSGIPSLSTKVKTKAGSITD